jgi:hypothetical protein
VSMVVNYDLPFLVDPDGRHHVTGVDVET